MLFNYNAGHRRRSTRGGCSNRSGGGGWRERTRTCVLGIIVSLSIGFWIVQLVSMTAVWHPTPPCSTERSLALNSINNVVTEDSALGWTLPSPPRKLPRRVYRSNGYLLLYCNGGLNQMRAGISDMVTIARRLNMTLVVPELDKRSFWADNSNFEDIFDVDHFIDSLRDEVRIIKKLPEKLIRDIDNKIVKVHSMPPVSWSNMAYYLKQILPLARKHKVVRFLKTDTRLANNGLAVALQKLRCRVNYDALKFNPRIEALGERLISILKKKYENFVALHLRYEMDMLAFSGCSHGCSEEEAEELTRKRYLVEWWKEKEIDPEERRHEGRCPLTPEETALVLKALEFGRDATIYIAAGTIYGGEKRMAALRDAYPHTVDKEMLLSPSDLEPMRNHSNQMAALDYMVSLASDVFVPTHDGNMAKVVEGHRRYKGFRKSIILDRKTLVDHLDLYQDGEISWDQFSNLVQEAHKDRMGQPKERKVIPGQPKVEDYFYANPQECLNHGRYL